MASITVSDLFKVHAGELKLAWGAGQTASKHIAPVALVNSGRGGEEYQKANTRSLVGHLNLIHPNQIQVLGFTELRYLTGLRDTSRADALRQVLRGDPACLIVAEDQQAPQDLLNLCDDAATPVLLSPLSSETLIESLHYYLSNLLSEVVTVHGVFMEVTAIGVLLTGTPGVGKSELALELITRGHRLVADDVPQFSRVAPDILNGTCPEVVADFLEVRGIGMINIRELFGDNALRVSKYLRLIIDLQPLAPGAEDNRLEGTYTTRKILDHEIPEITLPVAPGRNLAVLVETAARNHILRMSGYKASEDFVERQTQFMEDGGGD